MAYPRKSRAVFDAGTIFAQASAAVAVIAGGLVLTGWAFDIPVLKSLLPGMPTMKANTAICLIFSGVAFWFVGRADRNVEPGFLRHLSGALAGVALLVASLTLLEYLSGWNLGIDDVFFAEPGANNPGRMAPNTATALVQISAALLLLIGKETTARVAAAGLLGSFTALLGSFALLGWVADVSIGYRWGALATMAPPTGLVLFLLGAGTLVVAWRRASLQWLIGGRLLAGFILGLVLLASLSVVSYRSVRELLNTLALVEHTQEVRTHVRHLHANMVELHAAVRGFVITGQQDHLDTYYEGLNAQAEKMAVLRRLTADDPRQQARLDSLEGLIAQRVDHARELIELRRSAGMEAAAEKVSSGRGVALMNQIRAVVNKMDQDESALLAEREEKAAALAQRTFLILPVGTILSTALFVGVLFFLNLQISERKTAEAGARESEERLSLALQAAEIGHWELDLVTGAAQRTPLHDKIFGYAEMLPEWNYEMFLEHVHLEDRSRVNESFKAGVDAGDWDFECRIIRADGQSRWIWARGHVFNDMSGAHVRMLGLVRDITERKQAEAALAEQKRLLQSLTDNAAVSLFIMDEKQQCVFMNPAAEHLTGYTLAETQGRPLHDVVHHTRPDGSPFPLSECPIDQAFPERNKMQGEEVFVHKDGHFYTVAFTASPLRDEAGIPVGTIIEVQDITERKQADEALRDAEQRMRLATEASEVGIWEWNLTSNSIRWDGQMFRLYGITPTSDGFVDYSDWSGAVLPEDLAEQEAVLQETARSLGRSTREFRIRRRSDGEVRVIRAKEAVRTNDRGEAEWVVGTNRDITEQKLAEEEIRRLNLELEQRVRARTEALSEANKSLAMQSSLNALSAETGQAFTRETTLAAALKSCVEALVRYGDAAFARIWTLEPESNVLVLRASAGLYTHLDGAHARVPVGKFKIGMIAEERQPHLTNQVIGDPRVGDQEWARREGMVAFAGYPLMVGERLVGVIALFARRPLDHETLDVLATTADIVALGIERLSAEESVRKLNHNLAQKAQQLREANKELESFSYSVSHDLRAPLRHIDGFIKLLAKRESERLEPTSARYLETIATAAGKMGVLIDELLAFSRTGRQAIKITVIDLNKLIDRSVNELAPETNGRKIKWEIARLPRVIGDPTLLGVVTMNLLSNAIKYTGGRDEARIEIGVDNAADGHATIFVKDNGAGFDMRYADKLFGVFQRLHRETEFEGTGIGLATVQRIVNRHGGSIWVEAEPDKGATFFVKLKKAEGEKNEA